MQCGPHSLARSEKGIFPAANARLLPTTPQISTSVKQAEEQGYTHMRNEDNIGTASYDDITQNLLPPRLKRRLEKEKELIASYGAIRVKEYVPQRVNAIEVLQSPPPPPYAVIDHLLKPQPADDVDSEPLPPYSCSIHKSGMVSIKQECGKNGGVSMDRSWKKCHLELWGTLLCINISQKNRQRSCQLSMQGVQAGVALDYKKYRNVLRIRMPDGRRLLLRASSDTDMISWIEHLQASANISRDFDVCGMPRFLTVARSTDRLQGTIVNLSLSTGCRTLVSVCGPHTTIR